MCWWYEKAGFLNQVLTTPYAPGFNIVTSHHYKIVTRDDSAAADDLNEDKIARIYISFSSTVAAPEVSSICITNGKVLICKSILQDAVRFR